MDFAHLLTAIVEFVLEGIDLALVDAAILRTNCGDTIMSKLDVLLRDSQYVRQYLLLHPLQSGK